jgi:predicted ATPase/class 3 adenylate cyclase
VKQLPTGMISFLFTDIEGSTQLWDQYPAAMGAVLSRHCAGLRAVLEAHRGVAFKWTGDGYCAAFGDAMDALHAAIEIQQGLCGPAVAPPAGGVPQEEAPLTPERGQGGERRTQEAPLRVRVALHTGAAEAREGDYFGHALSRVARIVKAGHGGQVLLSQATTTSVQNHLPPAVSLLDLGLHRLRDLPQPEHIYQLLHPDLPAEFPPLRSLSLRSHNLPQQTTSFVGREQEMAATKQLLAASRLLTLTGAGGTGKTRLSLQLADDLLTEYEDGVWLVELAALADPALVPHAVAAVLAVREEPGKPLTETLVEYLEPRQLLLILDNCEHLLAASAELVHTLIRFCPKLRIVATSREGLKIPGEQSYRVPSLTAPDPRSLPATLAGAELVATLGEFEAVQMFLDRAASIQSTFALTPRNARAVAQVCHRLDGIPLAIELAAARLKLLSVEQLAPGLDSMFRLLTGGSRVALRRQQTLRYLIDWSYDLLTEAEKFLLRRLSVFAGGFTLEAVLAVCAGEIVEPDGVLDLLGELVEKSLVWAIEPAAEPRYRLLEPIRQYASEKLWEAKEGQVARLRYRSCLLRLAEQALAALSGPERELWLERLVAEYDNLRAALGPAARTHPLAPGGGGREDLPLLDARLAQWGQVVEQLVPTYRHLSRRDAALGVLEDYAALCQAEGNAEWLARGYTMLGIFHRLHSLRPGQEISRSMYQQAIAVCEAHGLEEWAAYPRLRLAHDLALDGVDLERAEALALACPAEAESKHDVQWLVNSGPTLGPTICCTKMWIAAHRADWEALQAAFQQSLAWGGPSKSSLQLMLAKIDAICRRQGEAGRFQELCRFMVAECARAGLEPPLQQWFLEPALPRSPSDEPGVDERFEGEAWHPALRWYDPTGCSRIDRETRPGWLGLVPPAGCNLWPETDVNAPRLLARVQGDFVAETHVELGGNAHVLAGLLLWRDARQFVRLELQRRTEGSDIAEPVLELCTGGYLRPIARGQCAGAAMWLRLERAGNELRALYSEEGQEWLACGGVCLPPDPTDEVGLAVVPHDPGSFAWFDTFRLWRAADV